MSEYAIGEKDTHIQLLFDFPESRYDTVPRIIFELSEYGDGQIGFVATNGFPDRSNLSRQMRVLGEEVQDDHDFAAQINSFQEEQAQILGEIQRTGQVADPMQPFTTKGASAVRKLESICTMLLPN